MRYINKLLGTYFKFKINGLFMIKKDFHIYYSINEILNYFIFFSRIG